MIKHTFVICAYKESEYLEECIKSIKNQSIKSKVIITTSTDNLFIRELAEKYAIKLYIADHKSNIASDWNYAYSKVNTPYVTIGASR
ncbi:MAG: glycosyltransferase [Lachnospiraceae bacterium]